MAVRDHRMISLESLEPRRLLNAGQPDPGFGAGGTALVDFNWANGYSLVNHRLPDGKLLIGANVGGNFSGGATGTLVLVRLHPDGALDTSFGVAGQLDTGVLAHGQDVSVHPTSGKIAIASKSGVADEINVAVLSADGVPDATFDGDGRRVMTFPRNERTWMHVAWQGEELIVAAADDLAGDTGDAHLVTPAGEKISSAGPIDLVTLPLLESSGTDLFVDDAGRYYVVGVTAPYTSNSLDWLVARYNADGTRDQSYGSNGQTKIDAMLVFTPTPSFELDGAVTLFGIRGSGLGGVEGEPKRLQIVRLLGGAGAVPDMVLNQRGSLIVNTDEGGEHVSLYIRGKDGQLVVRVGDFARSFARSRVKRIALFTYGGNDTVTIHPGVKGAYVDAGEGEDTINGGQGDDALLGGGGKDRLFGFDGNDRLLGGASNDYLLGGAGKDDLFGQGGIDTLSGAGGNDRLFGGNAADFCYGGNGTDGAAESEEDTYDGVETMMTLTGTARPKQPTLIEQAAQV